MSVAAALFQLVGEVNPEYDTFQLAFIIVWLAVFFILIVIYRERRKKNKYDAEGKPNRDDPNLVWGPLSGGDPIGPPK